MSETEYAEYVSPNVGHIIYDAWISNFKEFSLKCKNLLSKCSVLSKFEYCTYIHCIAIAHISQSGTALRQYSSNAHDLDKPLQWISHFLKMNMTDYNDFTKLDSFFDYM